MRENSTAKVTYDSGERLLLPQAFHGWIAVKFFNLGPYLRQDPRLGKLHGVWRGAHLCGDLVHRSALDDVAAEQFPSVWREFRFHEFEHSPDHESVVLCVPCPALLALRI